MHEGDQAGGEQGLEDLLAFIRDSRGIDFTGYKRTSLTRRIRKRMHDIGVDDYVDYRDRLESSSAEFGHLLDMILINVTAFFRDDEAWTTLRRDVVPELLDGLAEGSEIRVWSAGCASGEEAYSLAMMFAEALGVEECVARLKIYGTDIDEDALRQARNGVYSERSLRDLPPELTKKYFEPSGTRLAFRSDLRRRVIFGRHDVTRDAPISKLDLLVCRNTLMYFNVETQSQVLDRFHFALREGGSLFLGKAEMLLSDGERFDVASKRHRIFRRSAGDAWATIRPRAIRLDAASPTEQRDLAHVRRTNDLAMEHAPYAMVTVDMSGTVVSANAQMRAQFGLSPRDIGVPFRDLEVSYRPIELRSLIEQAHNEHRPIRLNAVERFTGTDEAQYLDIHIQPLWSPDGLAAGVLISFLDTTIATRLHLEVKRSREELETGNEELQSTNEELETTNEELQSSIEELETTNEELQSTNEELETTNEEIQSTNEELDTMNEELRERTGELDEVRTFLEGVLSSVAAGVVVLDADLTVRTWNRGAEELWGLRAEEVRHEDFFALDFGLPTREIRRLAVDSLATGRRSEVFETQAVNRIGRTITCAITCSPMRDDNSNNSSGVVLLIEDTTRA